MAKKLAFDKVMFTTVVLLVGLGVLDVDLANALVHRRREEWLAVVDREARGSVVVGEREGARDEVRLRVVVERRHDHGELVEARKMI